MSSSTSTISSSTTITNFNSVQSNKFSSKIIFYLISTLFLFTLIINPLISFVQADEKSHKYFQGELVQLWVNQVGPHYNPQETYGYYTLPFCRPAGKLKKKFPSLGEALQGIELTKSDIGIHFKENTPTTVVCANVFTAETAKKFAYASLHQYWYQLYIDELPMWAMVGGIIKDENNKDVPFIYTHQEFSIGYNGERIVEVNLTTGSPIRVKEGDSYDFSYSVSWTESEVQFDKRFRRYLDYHFFEHKIHWFSIFNSFMMVLFLAGLVFMILMRTLRGDYAKYAKEIEDGYDTDQDFVDDSGWKQVHGDVFRMAPSSELLFALIGTGYQLVFMIFVIVGVSIVGSLYDQPGAVTTSLVFSYALTTCLAGYFSASYYAQNGGKRWIKTMLYTATIFPAICCGTGFLLNWVAVAYKSLTAIPFLTMVAITALWGLVSVPLVFGGTIIGKNIFGQVSIPCRVNPLLRYIPNNPWYKKRWFFILNGGILPFGSIFIEMYFIFTSFWNYKYYYVYGFMLLVFVILIIVTTCVSIASTYFLLNSEDYRWPWTSFLSGASIGIYAYFYAIYFFITKTNMNGFFQTSFYFGYMALFCITLALTCGAIGFVSANWFVRMIYRNIRVD